MSTVEVESATRAASVVGRLELAWRSSAGFARRSVVAAAFSSCVLAAAEPVAVVVRVSAGLVGVLLAAAAFVDLAERRLPNGLLALAGLVALTGPVLALDPVQLAGALAGGLVAGGLVLLVRLTRGVGMGDVKAAAVVGASAAAGSLVAAPVAVASAAFAAATYGLLARRQRVPLGPSLWFGWAVAVFGTSSGWW